MILTINGQIEIPVLRFMDNVSKDGDGVINRMAVADIDSATAKNIADSLANMFEMEEFFLTLKDGEDTIWDSTVFTKMEYFFEATKDEDGKTVERNTINFLIR